MTEGSMDERTPQEYAYITDGITRRMQTAIEKMAESNRMFRSTVRWVCIVMLIVVLIVTGGFLAETKIWMDHVNHVRSEVQANETIPQLRDDGGH